MKNKIVIIYVLSFGLIVNGEGSKKPICKTKSIQAATALFKLNTSTEPTSLSTRIEDWGFDENRYEVWDVEFEVNDLKYSPYRIITTGDSCFISGMQLPYAN